MAFISTQLSRRPLPLSIQGQTTWDLAKFITSISVAGSPIKLQSSIKNLGVYLDSKMSFDEQVSEICKASYFHIRALRHIRSSLTTEACKTIATGNSRISTWLLQLSSSWHIYLKPCSTTACYKIDLLELLPKNLGSVTSRRFFLISTGFPSVTELVSN